MTNDLTKVIEFLNEQKRLRAEATSGEWQMKRCPVKAARVLVTGFDYDLRDKEPSLTKSDVLPVVKSEQILAQIEYQFCDAKFIAASANNYTTIIDMLLKAIEALQFYDDDKNYTKDGIIFKTNYSSGSLNFEPFLEQEQDYGFTAQQTLKKIQEKIKGE